MTLKNPNFLVAGAAAGEAAEWHVSTRATYDVHAGFVSVRYPGARLAVEQFDWGTMSASFGKGELAVAIFEGRARSGEALEDFEEGWLSDVYMLELPEAALEVVVYSSIVEEAFDEGWNLSDFTLTWIPGRAQGALWDGTEDVEAFEGSWVAGYATNMSQVTLERAVFWGGQETERFDKRAWPDPPTP